VLRLDDHLLAPDLGELRAEHADHQVRAAARRVGDDQPHRLGGIGLPEGRAAAGEQEQQRFFSEHVHQFALIPAFLMSAAFSVSSFWIIVSNSRNGMGSGSQPSLRICALISGDSTSAVMSLCSFSTIARGVFDGTSAPTFGELVASATALPASTIFFAWKTSAK